MKAKYHHFDNEDQLRTIRGYVKPLMPLMPCWVREVNVYSLGSMELGPIACRLDLTYRYASIDVSPDFFDHDAKWQGRLILHEFVHTLLGELHPWVENRLIAPLKEKNAELYSVLQDEFTARLERVVQEFTYLLEPLLGK